MAIRAQSCKYKTMAVSCFMRRVIRFCASFSQPFLPSEIAHPPLRCPRRGTTSAPAPSAAVPTTDAPAAQVVHEAMNECGLIDIGVSGISVITVQRWLNRLDNAALTVNGVYGTCHEGSRGHVPA